MHSLLRHALKNLIALAFVCLSFSGAFAQGFGIYDARALALGGTSVALSSTSHAQFYNPALLSLHDGWEEKTMDGRFYFPMLSTQVSDALEDLISIDSDNLEDNLSASVSQFNVDPSTANAGIALSDSQSLLDAINTVDEREASAEGFFGISIAEPSDRQGGAFHLGVRLIGGGTPDISDTDLALLEDYVEGLEFVSSSGQQGVAHPELFNADGSLIDPTASLTSTATGRGAAIVELGVSLSHEYQLRNTHVALGVTPKLMTLRTYEVLQSIDGTGVATESTEDSFRSVNADIGAAIEIADRYRIGFAVKDIVSEKFATELGGIVRIKPKARIGFAYVGDRIQLGLDYDLDKTEPVGTESALQELTAGVEWHAIDPVFLRLGYRHDLEGNRADVVSAGIGFDYRNLLFDVTYSLGDDGQAVALQLGHAF